MAERTVYRQAFARVVRRPWLWILRYLLALVPGFAGALVLMVPLAEWFRRPVIVEALENRSLDLLLDAVRTPPSQDPAAALLWIAGLLGIPVGWAVWRLVWLWLEGGVLTTYATGDRVVPRAFVRAGFRWFGSFLLISFLVAVSGLAILIGAGLLALLGRMVWAPLVTVIVGLGLILIIAAFWYGELARVAAVTSGDKHVLRAFRRAGSLIRRRAWPLLGLLAATVVARGSLFLLQRGATLAMPLSWWAATFVVQQAIQIAVTAVGLYRRAGEVALGAEAETLSA